MSLRLRLLAGAGAVALIALVVADLFTYSALRSFLLRRIDQSLTGAHFQVERSILTNGGLGSTSIVLIAPGTYVELRDAEGYTNSAPIPAGRFGSPQATPRLPAQLTGLYASTGSQREPTVAFTTDSIEPGGPQFWVRAWALSNGDQLILAFPLDQAAATLHHLFTAEAAVTAGALVAAVGFGWFAIRVGLRPLTQIEMTAEAIAAGDLDSRVPGDTARTEVGRLARTLNTMLGHIQRAFSARDATEAELRASEARLRQFVADASHELRTPIAAVSAYAELFELGASSRPDDLNRVMAGIRSETARMGRLVEELLLLARLDEGRAIEPRPVELVSLASEAVDAASAISANWPVRLEATQPVEIVGDGARLRQVLDNLLANVRAHTPPGTHATVTVQRLGTDAVVSVEDNGPGLTDADANLVFERFYRAEQSRSRDHGGSGLGLAIVAAIVAAHNGTVRSGSNPVGGAAFTITLPLPLIRPPAPQPPLDRTPDHTRPETALSDSAPLGLSTAVVSP